MHLNYIQCGSWILFDISPYGFLKNIEKFLHFPHSLYIHELRSWNVQQQQQNQLKGEIYLFEEVKNLSSSENQIKIYFLFRVMCSSAEQNKFL